MGAAGLVAVLGVALSGDDSDDPVADSPEFAAEQEDLLAEEATRTLRGNIYGTGGPTCENFRQPDVVGRGPYFEDVEVSNGNGEILAPGSLVAIIEELNGGIDCVWEYAVPDVPTSARVYEVRVGAWPEPAARYTLRELNENNWQMRE